MKRVAAVSVLALALGGCSFSMTVSFGENTGSVTVPAKPAPAIVVANPVTAAELPPVTCIEPFGIVEQTQTRWTVLQRGTASAELGPGRVILDMPLNDAPGNRVQYFYNKPLRLLETGDVLRICWDQQIVEDRRNGFYNGLCLGTPEGKRIVVSQSGRKNDDPSMGVPHDLKITGAADDNVDHGTGMLHFDLVVTLEDAKRGAVRLDVRVFEARNEFNLDPNRYLAEGKQVADICGRSTLPVGRDFQMFFFVDREDAMGDAYGSQARSKIAVSNVFMSEVPGGKGMVAIKAAGME